MKRLVFKGALAALCIVGVLFFTISGCDKSKGESEKSKDENEIIHGKWQLTIISPLDVEGVDLMSAAIDISRSNIIFEFKANNVLTVSSNEDNDYVGFKAGNHFYEVTHTDISNGSLVTDLAQHVVEINTISYCFSIGYGSDRFGSKTDILGLSMVCWGECDKLYNYAFIKK